MATATKQPRPPETPALFQEDDRPQAFGWAPWAAWGVLTALLMKLSASHRDLLLNDSFRAFERARALWSHPGQLKLWVHEYYPVGYAWLIGILAHLTGDAFSAARILSVAAASATMAFVILVVRQQTRARYQPLMVAGVLLLLGSNFNFLQLGTLDNTDMVAVAPMMASVYWLGKPGRSRFWGAGIWLGVAYLMRYTALTMMPGMLMAIFLMAKGERKARLKDCLWFLVGFIGPALVQMIPSMMLKGNPLWNQQTHNVWFALHGQGNWGMTMTEAIKHNSLGEIIREAPAAFVKNYIVNLYKVLCYDVFGLPIFWMWLPGFVVAWLGRRNRLGLAGIGLTAAVFGAALCLAFVTPRTTLFLLPITCILAACAMAPLGRTFWAALAVMAGMGLASVSGFYNNKGFLMPALHPSAGPSSQEKVTEALADAGMENSNQVLSLSFTWYNARNPYREGYRIPWSYHEEGRPIGSEAELVRLVREKKYRYIISDGSSVNEVPGLKSFWPRIPTELRPDTVFIENEVCVIALRYQESENKQADFYSIRHY